jgi:8-oxo-dGTP pyrophosphatase MutT (NUDIX family)
VNPRAAERVDALAEGRHEAVAPAAWHALAAATRAVVPRVPFRLAGREVGSVAQAHLPALRDFADLLVVDDDQVALRGEVADAEPALARINARLRRLGLVVAWRDETYPVVDPRTLEPLTRFERAASRFWGTLTFGAHANGYVRGADGRPAHLWIAQRSFDKPTDPGRYDNLVGGGVADGQTPEQALVREGFEEAGLTPAQMAGARASSVLLLARDVAEGFQHEWLYTYDLELAAEATPVNQDGEVAGFQRLEVGQALALAATGEMTVDAALVTLDFAFRHRLIDEPSAVAQRLDALRIARRGR